ncbi:MAG: acetolactate synthase small subunit [Candidatus Omnitrophica bacterium]|nr:acetolactate synthase small subunit [Candidatus Omnitrophota bacterium]MBU4479091.1 acetolactate synthase small subunit [Candidatus Omnitrophota bacterium]MCG2703012.1 acetolactate synthase small subunit [Candidatus Omnitrophota bacterium]
MKHIIYALVDNKPGVLARISGLFSARGFNIDSLAVGETHDPTVSRVTMVVNAQDERILEQIKKQLDKLIDVMTVIDLTKKEFFERELVLLKLNTAKTTRQKLLVLFKNISAKILSYDKKEAIVEITAAKAQLNDLLAQLSKIGIKELVRTGIIAIGK